MNREVRYKGAIRLSAIGDALGWMTEFEKSTDSLLKKYGTEYISEFYDWEKNVGGRFNGYSDYITKGSYSDDTQLLLSVARSIGADGTIDQEYFSKIELPSWLLYARGAGRTIKNAARKIERKSAKWNYNFFTYKAGKITIDYRESGANGAAMRILPIALANFGHIEKIKEEIFANSIVTHGHPRAIIGALLYGYAINTTLNISSDNFSFEAFLTELGRDIHQKLSIPFIEKKEFRKWEKEWDSLAEVPFRDQYHMVLNETQGYLRMVYKSLKNNLDVDQTLGALGCYNPDTKGSGISTVIAGIYLFCKYHSEPILGVERAVNSIGSDTDSIAAFTGGLSGSLHGTSIIPQKYQTIQDLDYLDKIALRLMQISETLATDVINEVPLELEATSTLNSEDLHVGKRIFYTPLGFGKIVYINKIDTLDSRRYRIIVDIDFEIGQSCRFSWLRTKS